MYTYPLVLYAGIGVKPSDDLRGYVPEGESFEFLIRGITRKELRDWKVLYSNVFDLQDRVLKEAVLSHPEEFHGEPWNWDNVYAGIVESVIQSISSISGFEGEPDPRVISEVEEYLLSEESGYDLMIMTALNYKLSELREMDATEWYTLIGISRRKLTLLDLNADAFIDPEAVSANKPQRGGFMPSQTQRTPNGPAMLQGSQKPGVERMDTSSDFMIFSSE